MGNLRIDLFSDVLTKPSAGMRRAMAEAEVGDEQKQEDPSTTLLQEMVAELLGKEAAVFLPSGAMCNQIAIRAHCRQGEELITDRSAHIRNFEVGGAAAMSGVQIFPLDGERGIFTSAQVRAAIRPRNNLAPRTRMVSVENTCNMGGGAVFPISEIAAIAAVAREHKLAMHMDGARLMNAVVKSGVAASEYARHFDSLWMDFSKGLGCPIGAVLAGSREFIEQCWPLKHQFGGAMRQSGIIAAAGVYALRNNVDRLAEDHGNADALARGLAGIPGLKVEPVETNMVFFTLPEGKLDAAMFLSKLAETGVRMSPGGPRRIRAVTHLDVTAAMIPEAIAAVERVLRTTQEH